MEKSGHDIGLNSPNLIKRLEEKINSECEQMETNVEAVVLASEVADATEKQEKTEDYTSVTSGITDSRHKKKHKN